jgi:hypothetical protein
MTRPAAYAVAGVLTLLIALVSAFPARVAYDWFAPDELRLGAISGSVWRGSASDASVGGLFFRDLRWTVRPARLLRGALSFAVEARPASGFVEGAVDVGLAGTLTISDLTAALPLTVLQGITRNPGLSGSLSVQLDEARLDGNVPVAGEGSFTVQDLVIPQIPVGSMGGYRGEMSTQPYGVLLTYEDTDGVVDIQGRIEVQRDGKYLHTALLRPKVETPAALRTGIELIPLAADGSGWHEWRIGEGSL